MFRAYTYSKRSLRKLRKKMRALERQNQSIDDILDNNLREAKRFYDSQVISPDIQPYGIMNIARAYRNTLVTNNLWSQCYQEYYDNLKVRYKKYVHDLQDFETYELAVNS